MGHNTDGTGALRALQAKGEVAGKNVIIIGAGGTAKAIGHTLKDAGAKLTLTYHRNRERGQELADQQGLVADDGVAALTICQRHLRSIDLVVTDTQPVDHAIAPAQDGSALEHQVPAEWAGRLRQYLADVGPGPQRQLLQGDQVSPITKGDGRPLALV